jgi:hypothetical protein
MPNSPTSVPEADKLVSVTTILTGGTASTATFSTLSGDPWVALVDLTDPKQTFTFPNGIGGSYNDIRLYPYSMAAAIQIVFSTPANFVQIYKDNFPTPAPPGNGTVFLQVLDGISNPIVSIPDLDNFGPLSFSSAGGVYDITGIRVWSTGTPFGSELASVAFDSLSYNIVPEPSAVVLMSLGIVGLASFCRRSRSHLARQLSEVGHH